MIQLKDIRKEYKLDNDLTFVSLKNINVEFERGEFTAIIGPSGSGKSTLMHIVGLLDKPTSGSIKINNIDVATLDDNETSTLRNEFVGFVFQQFNLINKLTVLENVLLPTIYARKKIDYNARSHARYLLDRFGLSGKENSYPNKISGGQQQRVAIARSLVMKPNLILADEPTGNLDTKTGDEIMKLLVELNKEGITVIIVTHEPDIAARARRSVKIIDGEIVSQ